MQQLTSQGQQLVDDLSSRYHLSRDAIVHMLIAVNQGGGGMAQFNCPELGGSGQWMRGGMTMVGDMFNNNLKNTVNNLCGELSNALATMPIFPAPSPTDSYGGNSNQWWPADLGVPFSSGAQNDIKYAIFPNRLAIKTPDKLAVYHTLDHNIGGISQQQGGSNTLTFSSQYGTIELDRLPLVSSTSPSGHESSNAPQSKPVEPVIQPVENIAPQPQFSPEPPLNTEPSAESASLSISDAPQQNLPEQNASPATAEFSHAIIELIKKLAELRAAGVLSDEEFAAKKQDLLNRL